MLSAMLQVLAFAVALIVQPTPTAGTVMEQRPATAGALPLSLKDLSPAAQAAIRSRARFVFRLPDGQVWDSFYYMELREALATYDAMKPGTRPTGKLAAWGLSEKSRTIAGKEHRPHPLWHSLQPKQSGDTARPFVYVNTRMLSKPEQETKGHCRVGDEVASGVFEFTYHEFPRKQGTHVPVMTSPDLGFARGRLHIGKVSRPSPHSMITGEFLLIPTHIAPGWADAGVVKGKTDPTHTLVPAETLRMTPESYAEALLAGEAELVEWSFKRTTTKFGETFSWERRVVEIKPIVK